MSLHRSISMCALLVALALWTLPGRAAINDINQLVQTADHIGARYAGAVSGGQIVDLREFNNMTEFAAILFESIDALSHTQGKPYLHSDAEELQRLIRKHDGENDVVITARRIRDTLLKYYPVPAVPSMPPDLDLGAALYASHCAGCHGAVGRNDASAAESRKKIQRDFGNAQRQSLSTLFAAIGAHAASMLGDGVLTDQAGWSLTFVVASMRLLDDGANDEDSFRRVSGLTNVSTLVTSSVDELTRAYGEDGAAALSYLQSHPDALVAALDGLTTARVRAEAGLAALERGKQAAAEGLALSAYLDGLKQVEPQMRAIDTNLAANAGEAMANFRAAIRLGDEAAARQSLYNALQLIERSRHGMNAVALDSRAAYGSAFAILFVHGVTVVLLLTALALMFRHHVAPSCAYSARRALHVGWVSALLASAVTWLVFGWVTPASGATWHVGIALASLAGAAAAVFMVVWSPWWDERAVANPHVPNDDDDTCAERSQRPVTVTSFLAVYSAALAMVLPVRALSTQADADAGVAMMAGVGTAIIVLAAVPGSLIALARRFALAGAPAFYAACVLAFALMLVGHGIAALQTAGILSLHTLPLPGIGAIGLYPSVEGIACQSVLLLVSFGWAMRRFGGRKIA